MKTNLSFLGRATSTGLTLLAMFLSAPSARPQVVVKEIAFPGSLADEEGNSYLFEPFSPGNAAAISTRMQQVYSASEFFSSSTPNGGWIYGVWFRADRADVDGSYSADIPSLQIRLSITARGPDELSPIFAENIGSASALVISGAKSVGVNAHGDDPEPWTPFFTFSQPYFYDPSRGNLLMDVINVGGGLLMDGSGSVAALDAENVAGDGVSSVIAGATSTQIPLSGNVRTVGLVTRFTIVPVPEPSTWALLGMSGVILVCRYRHSNLRRKLNHVPH